MTDSRRNKPKPGDLRIELHGEQVDAAAVAKVLGHTVAILRGITKEMYGDADLIQWNLVALEFKCDSCGRRVSKIPATWTKDGADDLCPKCTKARGHAAPIAASDSDLSGASDEGDGSDMGAA